MKTNRYAPKKDSNDVPATPPTRRPSRGQEELQRAGSSRLSISRIQQPSFLDQRTQPSNPTGSRGSSAPATQPSSAKGDPRPRRVYPCDHCSKVFTTRQNLLSHHRIRQRVYPFKCDSCDMAFIEYSTLFKHKKIHAKVREKFKCSECEVTYLSKLGLKKHQKKCHPVALDARAQPETTTEDKSKLTPIAKDVHEPAEKITERKCSETGVVQESPLANENVFDTNTSGATDVISVTSDTGVISDVAVETTSVPATLDIVLTASEVSMVTSDPEVPSSSSENIRESPKSQQAKRSPRRSDHVLSETLQFETSPKQNRTNNDKGRDKTATGAMASTSEHSSDVCAKPVEKSKEQSGGKRKVTRLLTETKSRTANKENAQTSLGDHGWGRRYNCKFCPESFPQAVLLKTHVETTHLDSKRYCCWECDRVFANQKALDAHAEKHAARKFECKTCKKTFAQKITLDGHIRCHTREQPFQCDVCDRRFAHYQSRDAHMRFHTREKAYRCQSCDFKTSWRSSMSTHLMLHKGERPHKCKQCAMRFTQKSQLKTHMKGVHNPEKKCKVCGDYVKNRKAMVAHLAEHNGDNPFQCEYCDDGFVKMFQLKKHVLESHTLPNRCDECGAAFAYPSGLKVHKLSHTQKRDFKCDFENCGASFSRVSNLNAHRRLHTGNLPYACDICNRKYDRRSLLVVHVRNFHEAKRNRSKPRKSKYRDCVPRPRTLIETRTDPTSETSAAVAATPITLAETESQSEDTIIVTVQATVPTPKRDCISTRTGSDVETTQDTTIVTLPAAKTVSQVELQNSERRQSESEASFELSLGHQSMSGSQYMEVNSITTPPQPMTPLRNPDMESDARSSAGSDRQPVTTVSPHSPFTERLRQCLSPPKTLAPVEIWTASDDSCFMIRRLPRSGGSQGTEIGSGGQETRSRSSALVIGATERTDGVFGDQQRPHGSYQYQAGGPHDLVALSQVNETSLQKYKATSLIKRKDGGSTSSESTVGTPREQERRSQHQMVSKTGAKRNMEPSSFAGRSAKQQRVMKSPHKTGKPKGKIGTSSKTVKSNGPFKQKLKSNKLCASSLKRKVAKGGDALNKLAQSRKVSNTSARKRKMPTNSCSPKPEKRKTENALHPKIVPSSSGTKSSQTLSRKSQNQDKTKLKPLVTPVKPRPLSKTPGPKTPVKARLISKSPSPEGPVKKKPVSKTPRPRTPVKSIHVSTSTVPVKARPASKVPGTPVHEKTVSKTPKTTKRILATKQRKVSRRPVTHTPKKRSQGLKKAVPRKPAVVAARLHPTGAVKRVISDHSNGAKKPRILPATVTVQDVPIVRRGKSKQPVPYRKVSNSKSGSGDRCM
ncbi:uncharacterized protein LOC135501616 [Lineus longissimus]|uniref:uncharacterized protein LOC135501616 n=1 Tax=Lineus longissimus TaxID=88925 RepID=UPI00315CCC37